MLRTRSRGNVREFQIRKFRELAAVTGLTADAFFPRWSGIFAWMVDSAELGVLPDDKPATVRVKVGRHRRSLEELSKELGIDGPSEGDDSVVVWALSQARSMADGTSRAVGETASQLV